MLCGCLFDGAGSLQGSEVARRPCPGILPQASRPPFSQLLKASVWPHRSFSTGLPLSMQQVPGPSHPKSHSESEYFTLSGCQRHLQCPPAAPRPRSLQLWPQGPPSNDRPLGKLRGAQEEEARARSGSEQAGEVHTLWGCLASTGQPQECAMHGVLSHRNNCFCSVCYAFEAALG